MKSHPDYYFFINAGLLVFFGSLFMATLSAPESLEAFGNTNYYFFHQLTRVGIGIFLGFIAFKIPLEFLRKIAFLLLLSNIILLVAVFAPHVGTEFLGAKRWVSVGNNSFQPSEFLKISAILYLSAWLAGRVKTEQKKDFLSFMKKTYHGFINVFMPFLIFLGLIVVMLYLQKDISTLGIIGITLITIYFASGTNPWHTLITFLVGISSMALFIKIEPYRIHRLTVFFHPETDPMGIGLQMKQSLIAIGSGGIIGRGLGMSTQKFGFLPEATSDSIFSIIGEEMGMIGTTIIILLFLGFLWQGLRIANRTDDRFAKLTAIGISTWIIFQAFVNICSNLGLFPLSGIPLPFFSYGGSHVIAELIGVGILLNISKNAPKPHG